MKLLLYCDKLKTCCLYKHFKREYFISNTYDKLCTLNGLIVAECDFKIEEIKENYFLRGKTAYFIRIKNLHIFDDPKELIGNGPQNMCYCYDISGNKNILITIKPKLLCKILNNEETIIVRKAVLKRML